MKQAWDVARRLLMVSAQVLMSGPGKTPVEFGDGVLTGRGTFQKFYQQDELKSYLEEQLGTDVLPAAPGVFYAFKDESLRQQFIANRFRRREIFPRKRISERQFEEQRAILEPLMAAVATLGRLPEIEEFPEAPVVIERFGSLKRAFAVVRRVTGEAEWEAIAQRRREDLLVYLALARFGRRPKLGQLPGTLRADMRAFFGTYTKACRLADELLFRAGDATAIDEACKRSPIGKLLPDDLYVHRSALDHLEPILRIYEGCGRAYLGEVEGANIIKIHRRSGKLSYLIYPDFDTDPHPALARCVRLSLRTRALDCYDYGGVKKGPVPLGERDSAFQQSKKGTVPEIQRDSPLSNPPILHRKETFLHLAHPLRAKFARLTQQEEAAGLLDDPSAIGTRAGWRARLQAHGLTLRGHRLVRAIPKPI